MDKIHFATFNINGGVPYKKAAEYSDAAFDPVNYLAGLIFEYKLDVVCFQEVLVEDDHHDSMSYEIAQKSGLKNYKEILLSDCHKVEGRKMGVSIISRYPFIQSDIFMLENPKLTKTFESGKVYKSHDKGFLVTTIQTGAGEICCVTGHCVPFHLFGREEMEFKHIYAEIEKRLIKLLNERSHILIGSDFNTEQLDALMPEVFKRFRSIVDLPTRPNGKRHDYILCDRKMADIRFCLIKTCFDHYGCMGVCGWNV